MFLKTKVLSRDMVHHRSSSSYGWIKQYAGFESANRNASSSASLLFGAVYIKLKIENPTTRPYIFCKKKSNLNNCSKWFHSVDYSFGDKRWYYDMTGDIHFWSCICQWYPSITTGKWNKFCISGVCSLWSTFQFVSTCFRRIIELYLEKKSERKMLISHTFEHIRVIPLILKEFVGCTFSNLRNTSCEIHFDSGMLCCSGLSMLNPWSFCIMQICTLSILLDIYVCLIWTEKTLFLSCILLTLPSEVLNWWWKYIL